MSYKGLTIEAVDGYKGRPAIKPLNQLMGAPGCYSYSASAATWLLLGYHFVDSNHQFPCEEP